MEKFETYLKQYKIVVAIAVAGLVLIGFLISKIVPIIIDNIDTSKKITEAQKNYKDKQRVLESIKTQLAETQKRNEEVIKAFYRPIGQASDTESAIAEEFAEILVVLRGNSIKMKSIEYTYDPEDDAFVKNIPDKYSVAKLDMELIGTYKNFESFLKELYKHEHFLDIGSIEIVPYKKDKKILIVKMQLKLYAQK